MKQVLIGGLVGLILGLLWAGAVTPVTTNNTFLGLLWWRMTSPWTIALVVTGILAGILQPRLAQYWLFFLIVWLIGTALNLFAVWSLVGFSTGGEIIVQQIPYSAEAIAQSPYLANEFMSRTSIFGYPYSVMFGFANGYILTLAVRWVHPNIRRAE